MPLFLTSFCGTHLSIRSLKPQDDAGLISWFVLLPSAVRLEAGYPAMFAPLRAYIVGHAFIKLVTVNIMIIFYRLSGLINKVNPLAILYRF
ncbi:hypothetical protein AC480_00845 [miscellaneous Crenarchaeota group archaeon SMTZ1-55]|nr:MAG: hypothetical protein AC480_00845 [miscellaneous Crenarchaeota group archaeon SMTZ1-55]